jgi:anti-anti-sigma factor
MTSAAHDDSGRPADAASFVADVTEQTPQLARVSLTGELDIGTVAELNEVLRSLVSGEREIVIDLAGLSFVDSSGLRALLLARRAAVADGYELTVTEGPPAVERVLKMTGIDELLRSRRE